MKCHICQRELKAEPYSDWAIGERKQVTYRCPHPKYDPHPVPDHATLEMVLPDKEVYFYKFLFQVKDKWFAWHVRLDSILYGADCPISVLYSVKIDKGYQEHQIISIPRYHPLDPDADFNEHCQKLYDKIKPLVIFT